MKFLTLALLLFPLALTAQSGIPAGTVLPVRLDSTLNVRHLRVGQPIRARVMQNIPGTTVRRGAQVVGHILRVLPTGVELRFDAVVWRHQDIPISTDLRAVASMLEVNQAEIPVSAPARGMPPEDWTNRQIGGDMVYRGGGHVVSRGVTVGEPTPYGVRVRLAANGRCRGAINGNRRQQSLWLFSAGACGVYGVPGLAIEHAGRTTPAGTIELKSNSGPLLIRSGSGLLLRVRGARGAAS